VSEEDRNKQKMKRQLWGEFTEMQDEATKQKQIELDNEIMLEKRGKTGKKDQREKRKLQIFSF
jgi:hypothetical protein